MQTSAAFGPGSGLPDPSSNAPKAFYDWMAAFLLAVSAVLSMVFSHARFLWSDELFSLVGDARPSLSEVLYVQRLYPINIDPPTYHVLAHLCIKLLGPTPLALRLPAWVGFLAFQLCLYVFVKRISGQRAGIIALLLPMMLRQYYFSAVGRPYALLDLACVLSLLCWQSATRNLEPGMRRGWALAGLGFSLFLAMTSHYDGVLVLVPVCSGEIYRTFKRRQLDKPVILAILVSMASALSIVIPYQSGAVMYRQHYFARNIGLQALLDPYCEIVLGWGHLATGRVLNVLVIVVTLSLGAAVYRRFRLAGANKISWEGVALLMTGLIPVWSFLLGRFVTNTVEVKYAAPTVVAVAAGLGIAFERQWRRGAIFFSVAGILLCASLLARIRNIASDEGLTREMFSSMTASPEIRRDVVEGHKAIYTQSVIDFLLARYYEPDEAIRKSLVLIGGPEEMRWLQSDTGYVTTRNLEHVNAGPVISYDQFLKEDKPLVVLHPTCSQWEWLGMDLAAKGYSLQEKGKLFGGSLVEVQNGRAQMGTRQ